MVRPARHARQAAARLLRSVARAAVVSAAALALSEAAASPSPPLPPSPAAVALAKRRCGACHAVPAAGSRRGGWGAASMATHVRRVAMPPSEWALAREYLGLPPGER